MRHRIRFHRDQRGVAMLLVVVCVMSATVVTTAYLASRDNSGTIATNVSDSTSARWAADSGVELAVAVLETEADWRGATLLASGRLLQNHAVGDAAVTIDVTDLITDGAPDTNTQFVRIQSTAMVNGVQQTSTAHAFVPLDPGKIADVDLSEFAVFVKTTLTQANQALITRWPVAPLSELGRRIAIGTLSTSASSVSLSNSSAAIDTTVYTAPGASNSLINALLSPELTKTSLLDAIPFPNPPSSGETYSALTLSDLTMNGGTATVLANSRYRNVELKNNAVRTLKGNLTAIADNNFLINSGAKLVIDGNVKIVVFGNLVMNLGAIELKSGARLRLYVRGGVGTTAVSISDSYIGDLRSDSTRDNTGKATWMDPQRVTLFSVQPLLGSYEWRIERNSVIKGSLYAPTCSTITMMNTSAVYGRIAATALDMRDDAALFYDACLDMRCGYTNPKSAVFDADGHILSQILTLTSLDSAMLQATADLAGVTIKSDTGTKTVSAPSDLVADTPEVLGPGDPTPRTVYVEYDLTTFGNNVSQWEH